MHPSYDIRCYDPAAGEDFTFSFMNDATFSSLQHGFFAIRVTPKTTVWNPGPPTLSTGAGRETYARLLSAALKATSSTGFVSVSHLTKRMHKLGVPKELEAGHRLCDSGLGYFETRPTETDRLLAGRQQIQTYEEWIIGGCNRPFDLPAAQSKWYQKVLCFEFEFFLQQADRIGCMFYTIGETQEDIILVRPWEGAKRLISAFVSSGA